MTPLATSKTDRAYWALIERWAKAYKSDGCTKSPDFGWCIHGCWEHDLHYRYAVTIYGDPITWEQANTRLRNAIQLFSPLPWGLKWFSPAAWTYWRLVATPMGRAIWDEHRRNGLILPKLS